MTINTSAGLRDLDPRTLILLSMNVVRVYSVQCEGGNVGRDNNGVMVYTL